MPGITGSGGAATDTAVPETGAPDTAAPGHAGAVQSGRADRPVAATGAGTDIPGLSGAPRRPSAARPTAAGPYRRHLIQAASGPGDTGSQRAFISMVARGAITTQRKYGVPAAVTIAQAIDESGWGQSGLATRDHNLFGIKGTGPAGSDSQLTQEYENGQMVTKVAAFRVYRDVAESINDHAQLLASSGYYRQAMAERHDPNAFAAALTGVYATNPEYGTQLISLMRRYNLYRFDRAARLGMRHVTAGATVIPGLVPAEPAQQGRPEPTTPRPSLPAQPKQGQPKQAQPKSAEPKSAQPKQAQPKQAPAPPDRTAVPPRRSPAPPGRPHPAPAPVSPVRPSRTAPAPGAPASPVRPPIAAPGSPGAPVRRPPSAPTPGAPVSPVRTGSPLRAGSPGRTGAPTAAAAADRTAPERTAPVRTGPAGSSAAAQASGAPARPTNQPRPAATPVSQRRAGLAAPDVITAQRLAATGIRVHRRAAAWPASGRARYQQQLPTPVRNVFLTTAQVPLLGSEPLYTDVAEHHGVRWELLAACDWMQCEAHPRHSPVHGERLGTVNPDGTVYRTKSEALERCAEDLVELAAAVYAVDVTAPGYLSVRDLANVFAAFRWGALLRVHRTSALEFPYSVAGLTEHHMNMRWPNIAEPNAPDKPGGRFRQPFGAVPVVLSLHYPATV